MFTMPVKALSLNQLVLNKKHDDTPLQPKGGIPVSKSQQDATPEPLKSAHTVIKGFYVDSNGKTVNGYYKEISDKDNYPGILAKYCVAISVYMRTFLGKRCAEERLVYDGDKLIGTFSIAVPNFKPFLCSFESLPEDPKLRELVYPSVETLLKNNFAEILAGLLHLKDDDTHPGNSTLDGRETDNYGEPLPPADSASGNKEKNNKEDEEGSACLDFDMFKYPVLEIIKGARATDDLAGMASNIPGVSTILSAVTTTRNTAEDMALKPEQISNFPRINGRTHWPANEHPGNVNYLKRWKSYLAFQALAGNPGYINADGKTVTFQDQFFNALLKMLIVYDPSMLKSRLEEYLGDSKLDFLSLEPEKNKKLAEYYWKLNNSNKGKSADDKPADDETLNFFKASYNETLFVEHMLKEFQKLYDELYRIAVYYEGCDSNIAGVSVPSFCDYLQSKPSGFTQAGSWVARQNEEIAAANEQYTNSGRKSSPVIGQKMPETSCYDMEKMEERYHQVWRDAFALSIDEVLFEATNLDEKISEALQPDNVKKTTERFKIDQVDFTEGFQIFEDYQIDNEPVINQDKPRNTPPKERTNPLDGLQALRQFRKSLFEETTKYFKKKAVKQELSTDDNIDFCNALNSLSLNLDKIVVKAFAHDPDWLKSCNNISDITKGIGSKINFIRHSRASDILREEMPSSPTFSRRSHTDPEIVRHCIKSFFDWISQLSKEDFENYILSVCHTYEPNAFNFFSDRDRHVWVKELLKGTPGENSTTRLARIFICPDGETKSNSMNTLLVTEGIRLYLEKALQKTPSNLQVVQNAINNKTFHYMPYVMEAISYAKNDPRFAHLKIEPKAVTKKPEVLQKEVYDAIFSWVARQKSKEEEGNFEKLMNNVITAYEKTVYWKGRTTEVRQIMNNPVFTKERKIAMILSSGSSSSTFNELLFKELVETMKAEFIRNKNDPHLKCVSTIHPDDYKKYLINVQQLVKPKTYAPKVNPSSTPQQTVSAMSFF